MRRELAQAVAGLVSHVKPDCPYCLTDDETHRILQAADIVTLARTGVETDYRGDIIDAHAPEMPTRFAKQLAQVMRPGSRIIDVRRRLQRPRATTDRALQALHVLGLLICDGEEEERTDGPRYIRHYSLGQSISLSALSVPDLSVDNLF